ncbi:MAG: hypothetical protein MUC79_15055 [Thiobacillaceae bacterium]|nr:hypothetical protein [Thiobacillaceae bacterium]
MTTPTAAPEIFQLPLADLPPDILPADAAPGTPEFEQAVIMAYALLYAERGWQALVTVDREYVRVLAIPAPVMDPRNCAPRPTQQRIPGGRPPPLEARD